MAFRIVKCHVFFSLHVYLYCLFLIHIRELEDICFHSVEDFSCLTHSGLLSSNTDCAWHFEVKCLLSIALERSQESVHLSCIEDTIDDIKFQFPVFSFLGFHRIEITFSLMPFSVRIFVTQNKWKHIVSHSPLLS
jgi:hypothetical protein